MNGYVIITVNNAIKNQVYKNTKLMNYLKLVLEALEFLSIVKCFLSGTDFLNLYLNEHDESNIQIYSQSAYSLFVKDTTLYRKVTNKTLKVFRNYFFVIFLKL